MALYLLRSRLRSPPKTRPPPPRSLPPCASGWRSDAFRDAGGSAALPPTLTPTPHQTWSRRQGIGEQGAAGRDTPWVRCARVCGRLARLGTLGALVRLRGCGGAAPALAATSPRRRLLFSQLVLRRHPPRSEPRRCTERTDGGERKRTSTARTSSCGGSSFSASLRPSDPSASLACWLQPLSASARTASAQPFSQARRKAVIP